MPIEISVNAREYGYLRWWERFRKIYVRIMNNDASLAKVHLFMSALSPTSNKRSQLKDDKYSALGEAIGLRIRI